ncbi:L-2-hydroxyglutarate oxidase [Stieleria varia]|uniref:L-2-hydroxyglutarate oxidase LhgO n=1 Tax=Stieleria varia TaxID=2528005 RepID=A0A5C6APY4_9BACT|nr:L-2-hydroxyglutarate oxidase [Stieleria varia]TWU01136.1 L-2-hydroxyglutarate oxidase LhgO [Stieleria varia]
MPTTDFSVIGGGIVGLATAWKLQQRYSDARVCVLESESRVGTHQTGHNSGVLHSGIYYQPGSVKARTCRTGKRQMESFCEEHAIAWERCGKVVVATSQSELAALDDIAQRAVQNGVQFERIDSDRLRELEPSVAGVAALHVPETGIVNYRSVAEKLSQLIRDAGGEVHTQFSVEQIQIGQHDVKLTSRSGDTLECDQIVNCAGLYSDRICQLSGTVPSVRIVPFRGEYYDLIPERRSLCRNLIYPVPDPSFPFLGVHFTRMIDGCVECGPNAVLALSRGGYGWSKINLRDLGETVFWIGFRRLAARHWRAGLGEMHRSISKAAFVRALQRLIPTLKSEDLVKGRAGVRAQAISSDGKLVDEFLIQSADRATHVLNAPSPGATASLAIADTIVDRVASPPPLPKNEST